jgi:DNA-damage-inducible protein J
MSKTEQVRVRLEPHIKSQANKILEELGFTMSDAVSIFMRQVISHRGLPFEVKIPNAETRAAIEELEAGGGEEMTPEEFRAWLKE